MKMKLSYILGVLLFALIVTSCEDYNRKVIEFEDIGFKPVIVLNARVLNTSDSLLISLSKNVNYAESGNSSFEKISGATVSFTIDGTTNYSASEVNFGIGERLYPFNYIVVFEDNQELSGKSFEIVAEHPDYETVRSTIELPKESTYSETTFIPDARVTTDFGYPYEWDGVDLTINDNPDDDNYYFVQVVSNVELDTFIFETEPGVFDTLIGVFSDGTYNTESEEIMAIQADGGVLLSDESFNGQSKKMRFFFEDYSSFDTKKSLAVANISRSDYLFISSYELYNGSQDFGFFSEPTTLYSNIENGLGLFSAQDIIRIPIPN